MKTLIILKYLIISLCIPLNLFGTETQKKKPTLIWDSSNSPPTHFYSGEFENKGRCDVIRIALEKELRKHFILDERSIPLTRAMTFFKDKRDYCRKELSKTLDRITLINFSPFYEVFLPSVIISKRGLLGDPHKKVSLKKIIESNKYIIGLTQTRRYGKYLDPIFAEGQIKFSSSFFKRPGTDTRDALYKMLQANRIQLYVGPEEEKDWMEKSTTIVKNKQPIDAYQIEEEQYKYRLAYIGCSKSVIGKKAMEIITKTLLSKEFNLKEKLLEGHAFWINKKELKYYADYFDIAWKEQSEQLMNTKD